MKLFISQKLINNRSENYIKNGYIYLWCKNRSNQPRPYYRFKIIEKHKFKYGYIVSRNKVPDYFKNVVFYV